MNIASMSPEQFHALSTQVLTGYLAFTTLAGACWLKDYKQGIPKDARLGTPQKAFPFISGIWLTGASIIIFALSASHEDTFPEALHTLLIYSPALLAAAVILPALSVGAYHLLKILRIAVGFLACILIITPAWFIGKMTLKAVSAWSQLMTKTLIGTTTNKTSERAR